MNMNIKEILRGLIFEASKGLQLEVDLADILLDHPADLQFGDYSSNIALKLGQKHNRSPRDLAGDLVVELTKQNNENIAKVEVAGPGFINFYLTPTFFANQLSYILRVGDKFGQNELFSGKKVVVEYTDPNPFKLFHVGHLMTNTIGESLSRLFQASGAETKMACYQGDVGMHVAKAIWGMWALKDDMPKEAAGVKEKTAFLGKAYSYGATKGEEDDVAKAEIKALNKKIYQRSDGEVNRLYDLGRDWSLQYFDLVYKRLGTRFDYLFFESQIAETGVSVVNAGLEKSIFEKSDGAVVFKGEKYGLHTRVFLNSEGLPTYEAKELGLAKIKYEKYPYDLSVVVTANEINEYFNVLLKVMSLIFPDLATKTKHLGHGFLRLPSGKMSSRTGEVVVAEEVIDKSRELILEKMKESDRQIENLAEISDQIAVGAIKYSILKQDIGKDVIFDFDKSLSFAGNSGPYLQYAYARTQSILDKAERKGIKPVVGEIDEITSVEKLLYRFPEVVERSCLDYAPHHIATYLYELASAFSSYYVDHQVVSTEQNSSYRVALTGAIGQVLKNGLTLLGIKAPGKM